MQESRRAGPDTRRRRWRRVRSRVEVAVAGAGLTAALLVTGCGARVDETSAGHVTALVTAAHANELSVQLGDAERARLAGLAADPDVDGAVVHVLAAGRAGVTTVDLEPRRPNGEIERGGRVAELVAQRVDAVAEAVAAAAAEGTATDPLPALDAAGRTGAGRIVLLTAGLGLTGPLDVDAAEFDQEPVELVDAAEAAGLVPTLPGREVVISGLGRTAGDQQPLGVAEHRWLRELWIQLCDRTGARCVLDDAVRPAGGPASTLPGPVVNVPATATPGPGLRGEEVVEVPAALLFDPDSCAVPDPVAATAALAPVLERLRSSGDVVHVSGRTAPVGAGDGRELSLCRAERAVALLLAAGVPSGAIGSVTGDGHLLDPPGAAGLAGLRRVVFTVVSVAGPGETTGRVPPGAPS